MISFVAKPLKGKKAKLFEEIKARMERERLPYRFYVTSRKSEETELAAKISEEENPVIVAVGGDGTLNGVLRGLKDPSECTLGLIPAGTGNDFAAMAGIPQGIEALDLILKNEPVYTDYLSFSDGLRSLNIAGLGIDVYILEQCFRMKFGKAKGKYFRSLLSALAKYRGQRVMVEVNGEQFSDQSLIACICNGTQFGGGIPICPPADIEDGKLDLFVASCPSRVKIPFLLIKLMRGKILNSPVARHILCESVRIVQVEGKTAQFDGELAETRTLTARVVHEKLKVFRP